MGFRLMLGFLVKSPSSWYLYPSLQMISTLSMLKWGSPIVDWNIFTCYSDMRFSRMLVQAARCHRSHCRATYMSDHWLGRAPAPWSSNGNLSPCISVNYRIYTSNLILTHHTCIQWPSSHPPDWSCYTDLLQGTVGNILGPDYSNCLSSRDSLYFCEKWRSRVNINDG